MAVAVKALVLDPMAKSVSASTAAGWPAARQPNPAA